VAKRETNLARKTRLDERPEAAAPQTEMQRALDRFEPRPFPTKIDLWRVVVQIPQPPETSAGGLVMPTEYTDRKEFATYVGYVIGMGPLCFTAVTKGGIDLKLAHGCKVGDWVHIGKHAGEKFRTADGTLYVVVADTEILGVVEDPEGFECLVL
jgi:co-chaperonin GroES (HSP10)